MKPPSGMCREFRQRLMWTARHMPITQATIQRLPPLQGVRLAMSIHLDIKMAPLLTGLLERGAELFLTTCNVATVRNEVVSYLVACGAQAQAFHGMSESEYNDAIASALAWNPTHLCEMGADLTTVLHKSDKRGKSVIAGLEATGSGIVRLSETTLDYPILNLDDLPVKEGLHNRYMVGLTTWHAFFNRTYVTLHGKRVLVVGYGLVGRGLCDAARAYGGAVMVTETDAARAHEAAFAGWHVVDLETGLEEADVVVTATGCSNVLRQEHFARLRPGAFLLNAGHSAGEIDLTALYSYPVTQVLPQLQEICIPGLEGPVYLLCGGYMANLTGGEGDSINAFDITLAVMAAGIGHIVRSGSQYKPGVHLLPEEVWKSAVTPNGAIVPATR